MRTETGGPTLNLETNTKHCNKEQQNPQIDAHGSYGEVGRIQRDLTPEKVFPRLQICPTDMTGAHKASLRSITPKNLHHARSVQPLSRDKMKAKNEVLVKQTTSACRLHFACWGRDKGLPGLWKHRWHQSSYLSYSPSGIA